MVHNLLMMASDDCEMLTDHGEYCHVALSLVLVWFSDWRHGTQDISNGSQQWITTRPGGSTGYVIRMDHMNHDCLMVANG